MRSYSVRIAEEDGDIDTDLPGTVGVRDWGGHGYGYVLP